MVEAWEGILGWAKRHSVKAAFWTDLLFQPDGADRQNVMLTRFAKVYGSDGCLRIATSADCELFAMSGERKPYKEAKLGVVQEAAWEDILLTDGDPMRGINVLKDYERNLVGVIKDARSTRTRFLK